MISHCQLTFLGLSLWACFPWPLPLSWLPFNFVSSLVLSLLAHFTFLSGHFIFLCQLASPFFVSSFHLSLSAHVTFLYQFISPFSVSSLPSISHCQLTSPFCQLTSPFSANLPHLSLSFRFLLSFSVSSVHLCLSAHFIFVSSHHLSLSSYFPSPLCKLISLHLPSPLTVSSLWISSHHLSLSVHFTSLC